MDCGVIFFPFHWRCLFQIREFHFVSIRRFYRIFNKINIPIIIVVITISRACILFSLLPPPILWSEAILLFLFLAIFPLVLYPADNISLDDTLTLILMLFSFYKRSLRGMVKYQKMFRTTSKRKNCEEPWFMNTAYKRCIQFLISFSPNILIII